MIKKFTMELVWHNCKTNPPKEIENDFLIVSDGIDVYEAHWYELNGFMIRAKPVGRWKVLYENLNKWYWADIRQTVQGESKFRGLIVDDLVEYINEKLGI